MIDTNDDVQWVKAQRPTVEPPDAEATGWARAALLAHTERSSRLTRIDSPSERPAARGTRRRKSGLFRSHRGMAAAAAVALMAAAGIAASVIGFPTGGSNLLGPAPASAAVLTLAHQVQTAPQLKGDATLVLHTNLLTEGPGSSTSGSFTGADLHLDDGRYYYAQTVAGLPEAVKAGPMTDYSLKAVTDAMSANATADPQTARAAYLKAVNPLYAGDTETEPGWQQDNVIWVSGIDVLGAAYGRPDVLAATLRVLSTVDGVTVTHVNFDGHDALAISMKDPGSKAQAKIIAASPAPMSSSEAADAAKILREKKEAMAKAHIKVQPIPPHLMTLTLDDQTGALLQYTDIGLRVTYTVTRVDAADYGL